MVENQNEGSLGWQNLPKTMRKQNIIVGTYVVRYGIKFVVRKPKFADKEIEFLTKFSEIRCTRMGIIRF